MLRLLARTGIVWPVPAAGPAPSAIKLPGRDHGVASRHSAGAEPGQARAGRACAGDDPPGKWRLNSPRKPGGCQVITSHIVFQAEAGPAAIVTGPGDVTPGRPVLPPSPAGSPDRHTLIIIAGVNAAAVAAAPGSRWPAASAAEWSIARAAGGARPGRSTWQGPGSVIRTAAMWAGRARQWRVPGVREAPTESGWVQKSALLARADRPVPGRPWRSPVMRLARSYSCCRRSDVEVRR